MPAAATHVEGQSSGGAAHEKATALLGRRRTHLLPTHVLPPTPERTIAVCVKNKKHASRAAKGLEASPLRGGDGRAHAGGKKSTRATLNPGQNSSHTRTIILVLLVAAALLLVAGALLLVVLPANYAVCFLFCACVLVAHAPFSSSISRLFSHHTQPTPSPFKKGGAVARRHGKGGGGSGGALLSDIDQLSLANVPPGSPLLWVHLAAVWAVTAVVLTVRAVFLLLFVVRAESLNGLTSSARGPRSLNPSKIQIKTQKH